MSLSKQVHVYSLDTSDFYNQEESKIHKYLNKYYIYRMKLKNKSAKEKDLEVKKYYNTHITKVNKRIKTLKNKLCNTFTDNKYVRVLNRDKLTTRKIVSVFESTLTRVTNTPTDTLTEDIMIVQTYFFDVIEDIILDGFLLDGEKYVCFTASAGQIRTKKTVFIKQSVLIAHQDTLMCGLTIEKINKLGGVNINKYLAYLALNNSATDLWAGFDITKSIVVDDMETAVRGLVDFIDDKTYKITRKKMDVNINHTDGCGMILPSVSKKNFMVRLPWIKGLLVSFDYNKFIETHKVSGIIKDIYGVEHDIIKEGIEVIFSKGQFKMYKYYESWKDYCDKYILHNCQAGKCNEEEDYLEDAKTNYQMIQTLTDMTDEELTKVASITNKYITSIGDNRDTKLRVLGVTRANKNKNYIQQALEKYPALLSDTYSKEILKQVKKSIVNEGRSGKLTINGKYTFISPDLYSYCEYLFLGKKNPKGLLQDGEVFCRLYKNEPKLDCLRSPHLYREHAVRKNIIDTEKSEWFTTDAVYVSCHDLISKIIMNDWDGDKSLVCADHTLIEVAERNMKGIVPLFYNMAKAGSIGISNDVIFNGLKLAYTGGNIGMVSNDITKIWNSDNVSLEAVKLLTMENNFVIDYAKTLYKPERPDDKHKLITSYTKSKTPHFFIYAKDKKKDQVEKRSGSVVNRLYKIIENPKLSFEDCGLKKFDYKMLMRDKNVKINQDIVDRYIELDLKRHHMINNNDNQVNNLLTLYKEVREKMLQIHADIYYIVDVLIEYLYNNKKFEFRTTLWEYFGDVIVENLNTNIKEVNVFCEGCGVLIEKKANYNKYCEECAKKVVKGK